MGKNHWLANPHKGLFRLDDIITQNPEMLTLKDTVQRVAANTSPVLIWGETGTGKELFAQSLHSHSSRARGAVCGAKLRGHPNHLAGEHPVRHYAWELYRGGKPERTAETG